MEHNIQSQSQSPPSGSTEQSNSLANTIVINFDGNFQHKRLRSPSDAGHFEHEPIFSLDADYDAFASENASHVNRAAKSSCHDRFKAGKEKPKSNFYSIFDEVGLVICQCRHGCVLKALNVKGGGEK